MTRQLIGTPGVAGAGVLALGGDKLVGEEDDEVSADVEPESREKEEWEVQAEEAARDRRRERKKDTKELGTTLFFGLGIEDGLSLWEAVVRIED